jgi:hypothetical protein
MTAVRTGFRPSVNGFRFCNAFPREPVLTLRRIGLPRVGLGNAAGGLCGGMVFAALDYFDAGRPVPTGAEPPSSGSALFRFVVRRLLASFRLPWGVLRYQRFMARPDGDVRRLGLTRRGLSWLTITSYWPQIRAELDAGRPVPLGLVAARGLNPLELGRNHVVLGYDYTLTGDDLVVRVYDPNSGPDDGIQLALGIAHPEQPSPITHNIDIGHAVRGFFPVRHRPRVPPTTG